jgi:hypothetical protein
MDILISFCNTIVAPGYPSLGIINADTMEFRVLELPPEVPETGMLGMVVSPNNLFIGLQYSSGGEEGHMSPPALLIFDRKDFKLLQFYPFQLVKDVHSLLLSKDENNLYVVSTGTDEVIEVLLEGYRIMSEKVFWRPEAEAERIDNHHLNSINEWEGDIYVSGFGKKIEGGRWSTALNGFMYNITKEEKITEGLAHPHSVLFADDRIAFCESRKSSLRFLHNELTAILPGYTRGLCVVGGNFFVGTSSQRKKSKSTGKAVEEPDVGEKFCTISRICAETLAVEKTLDLRDYAYEIYDLLPVEGTSHWPVRPPEDYCLQLEQAWSGQVQAALGQISEAVPKGEKVIVVDESRWQLNAEDLPDHQRLHFLEREGEYWGLPEDDGVAISELNRLRQEDVRFIAFGWSCFWWFDHYTIFNSYLREKYNCVLKNDHVIIFESKYSSS